jgi:hypothetical protein
LAFLPDIEDKTNKYYDDEYGKVTSLNSKHRYSWLFLNSVFIELLISGEDTGKKSGRNRENINFLEVFY